MFLISYLFSGSFEESLEANLKMDLKLVERTWWFDWLEQKVECVSFSSLCLAYVMFQSTLDILERAYLYYFRKIDIH